jgi:IS30 family transposase
LEERQTIATMWAAKASKAEIARELGRHPATVGRELARNSELKSPTHKTLSYHPGRADKRAQARARRPKQCKLRQDVNARLHTWVQKKLKKKWSPEQIAKELLLAFPHDPEMRVSHETIYQSLYVQSRGALRRELSVCLRTGRAVRRPAKRSDERRGRIPGMINISARPAEVADRSVPGHWESDLIIGKNSGSAIGTLVERSTRFVMLLHLPDRHGALEVEQAMLKAIAQMPAELRRSITHDQGKEMSNHRQITIASGMDIYFCDPHSPWQRGSNENTNGLLRQYFPKGTDLSVHSAAHLRLVAAELNDRPRKTLEWLTPRQRLAELLVATTP